MELSHSDLELLRRLEQELWREDSRFDRTRMSELLAPDFVEFGCSGRIYRREDILDSPRHAIHATLPLPDFAAWLIASDVALVTYNSVATHGAVMQYGRRSSIWSRAGAGWVLRFHQGTPYGDDA